MFGKPSLYAVLLIALAAVYLRQSFSSASTPAAASHGSYIVGRNKTALFVVAEHHGLSNVHLATAQSLLEQHPDIDIHFASFPILGKKFPRLSALAKRYQPKAKDIAFHPIRSGRSYVDAVARRKDLVGVDEDGHVKAITPPGLAGMKILMTQFQHFVAPWPTNEHLAIHNEVASLIDEVDPAIVVLDTIFGPAIEATRGRNRAHAFISPNSLIDTFPGQQPYGKMFWKYPAMGTGFPFPLPWKLVPLNIWINLHFVYNVMTMSDIAAKKTFLKERGVVDPINFYGLHRPDVPWLSQTMPGASVPLDFVPQNVTSTGPIVFSPAPAEEQDPALVAWMKQKPTVLINLGSAFAYSKTQSRQVIGAIEEVLKKSDLQVLWKYKLPDGVEFDWKTAVQPLVNTGRVKVSTWLDVDPPSLLQSGHIRTFVTHGGANGYHESIEAGVPQVVLPMWVDLYNFARLAEQIGVGVWGCRETSPTFTAECLSEAILKVAGGGPESLAMQDKAKLLSVEARKSPGREVAARVIAQLARAGKA